MLCLNRSFVPLREVGIAHILGVERPQGAVIEEKKKSRWKVPVSLMATGLAGAAVFVFRGCWHTKMSWPIRVQQHSYQVCLNCGIKRLFDEQSFRAYGPYSYDLQRLVALDRKRREADNAARAGKLPA